MPGEIVCLLRLTWALSWWKYILRKIEVFSFLLGLGREFSASSCGKLRPKSVWNKCWKADWFLVCERSQGKSIFPCDCKEQEIQGFPRRPRAREKVCDVETSKGWF